MYPPVVDQHDYLHGERGLDANFIQQRNDVHM